MIEQAALVLKALGEPPRLKIIKKRLEINLFNARWYDISSGQASLRGPDAF